MSKIEEKCKEKGVRLTEQRRIIAKVISDSKETLVQRTTQTLMSFIRERQTLIKK